VLHYLDILKQEDIYGITTNVQHLN